ncbi:hypothetical protein G5714_000220 [Onychostoma macrolepis]|uniref:Uncharacterized protein n=1 Tax=Onychostoma macrolepis TaxID=369639 RepID=A0A7J6DFZ6_9TELE|nr:hypothetical protein G5714_000220 [Onychostoma macrolepis]
MVGPQFTLEKIPRLDTSNSSVDIDLIGIARNNIERSAAVAFMSYNTMENLLKPDFFNTSNNMTKTMMSTVISATLPKTTNTKLTKPVNFTFRHIRELDPNGSLSCVYWNISEWIVDGCSVLKTNSSYTVCSCVHLSTFALIMQTSRPPESDSLLELLNSVCVIVGLVFFSLALMTFALCQWRPGVNNVARINICISLLLAHLLFLLTQRFLSLIRPQQVLCAVISGLLHFLFLSGFVWMFIEAVLLFICVKNLSQISSKKREVLSSGFLCVIGYVVALVVVCVSVGLVPEGYGSEHCWIKMDKGFIWSFLGPVCVILVLNTILFIKIFSRLSSTLTNLNAEVSMMKQAKIMVFKTLAQFVVLGCSWILGFFTNGSKVLEILFLILNSQQGTFIFLIYCVLNNEVRQQYRKFFRCSTEVSCVSGSNIILGRIDEGYEGDIETITNISPDVRLVLEPHLGTVVMKYVELVYSDGDSTATVRTIKPLDAEEIKMPKNIRTLYVLDVNDNPPIFQSKSYSTTVSEATAVGSDVLSVTAIDKDATTENKRITYSILPPVPDEFEAIYDRNACNIRLTKPLNYNNVQQYIFIVEAKDIGGLHDTTTVTITVEDFDNLNPYFDHCLYKASIEENQVGHFSAVTPEAIKAEDGDKGINEPVVYSITTVIPNKHQNNFEIDRNSGVISVTTALDREETEQISVLIQAAQQDDVKRTPEHTEIQKSGYRPLSPGEVPQTLALEKTELKKTSPIQLQRVSIRECDDYDMTSHVEEEEEEDEEAVRRKKTKRNFDDYVLESEDLEEEEENMTDAIIKVPSFPIPPSKVTKSIQMESAGFNRKFTVTKLWTLKFNLNRQVLGPGTDSGHLNVNRASQLKGAGSSHQSSHSDVSQHSDGSQYSGGSHHSKRYRHRKQSRHSDQSRDSNQMQQGKLDSLVLQLARIGGKDVRDCVHKILDRLFTNRLMAKFNMKGKGKQQKLPLETTKTYEAINAAVMKWDRDTTEATIKFHAAEHLKHAPGGREVEGIQGAFCLTNQKQAFQIDFAVKVDSTNIILREHRREEYLVSSREQLRSEEGYVEVCLTSRSRHGQTKILPAKMLLLTDVYKDLIVKRDAFKREDIWKANAQQGKNI